MPRPSKGPKRFWTGPNCFGYESKGEIQYSGNIFLVQSKTIWTIQNYLVQS